MLPFLTIILNIFFLFELSHFQTYCLYCSCWFLAQADLNHLSRLSFLLLCRLLGGTAGNWDLFFSSPPPPLQLIYFSDAGHSQDHPDQRTLRRFILSRTWGSTIPETAGTVHAKAASAEAVLGIWGKGQDQCSPARAQPLPLNTYLLICVFQIICEGTGCSACSVPQGSQ